MTQTITRLYESYDDALRAGLGLKEAGFTDRELSILGHVGESAHPNQTLDIIAEDVEAGAGVGGAIGATAGLMAGLGVLAIPGFGQVVAVGWLASTVAAGAVGVLAGGAMGTVMGALSAAGTPEPDASLYAERVRRGDSLVTVRVPDDRVLEATKVLSNYPSVDPGTRDGEPILPAGLPG